MSTHVINFSWGVFILILTQICAQKTDLEVEVSVGSSSTGQISSGNGNSTSIDVGVGNASGSTATGATGATATGATTLGNFTIIRGSECGATFQMYPGKTVQVLSTNFGVGNYHNNEACTWSFQANQCVLSAYCPCVDIPRSWECLGDYLKIRTDYLLQNQRFCGGNKPGQPIYSETDFLSVRFRSDGRITATGFNCYIRCEGPGTTIPLPSNVTCPQTSFSQRRRFLFTRFKKSKQ